MNKQRPIPHFLIRQPRGSFLILCLILLAWNLGGIVRAQGGGSVSVTGLDNSSFPIMRFLLEVMNAQGDPLNDLQPEQIQVMEDGYVRPVTALNRIQPGLQMILAVNESPNLTNQYQGDSYYRLVMQRLEGWAQSLTAEKPGNYSYVTNNGVQLAQMEDPGNFAQALAAYQPDLMAARPGLTSLTMALDLTTNPLPDPYMKRAILLVTPLPDAAAREALPNISERAAQLGTRVFVWLIAPGYPLESPEIAPLRQLADLSGGAIFLYNGTEEFPDPDIYFEPLRYIYQVEYESDVTASGEHRLVTSIFHPDVQLTAEEMIFELNISPPNPIFLAPPARIERTFAGEEEPSLEPVSYPLQILVEFPDGHQRELRYTRLYINDQVVAENLVPPFDQFALPLEAYEESTQLRLKVEVEDELGLNQTSIETLVELTVEQPQESWLASLQTGRGLAILVSLVVAALVLAAVIVLSSQRNIFRLALKRLRRTRDPLKQQVYSDTTRRRPPPAALDSPTVRKPAPGANAPAKLVRLSGDGNPIPQRVIPLIRREITLGADPQQALCVLDSPTVSPLHARIFQDDNGCFFVEDKDSTAGTWLNYNQVCNGNSRLEHSDILHFGLMAFRFEVNQPTSVRKLTVTPYQADGL